MIEQSVILMLIPLTINEGLYMATKNPTQRRKIRALEAQRDVLTEKRKSTDEKLKVVRTQLKHARATK